MVGDIPVDSGVPVVTLSISRICRLSLSEILIGVGLRACIHRDEYACVFVSVCICTVFLKKMVFCIAHTDTFLWRLDLSSVNSWSNQPPCLPHNWLLRKINTTSWATTCLNILGIAWKQTGYKISTRRAFLAFPIGIRTFEISSYGKFHRFFFIKRLLSTH